MGNATGMYCNITLCMLIFAFILDFICDLICVVILKLIGHRKKFSVSCVTVQPFAVNRLLLRTVQNWLQTHRSFKRLILIWLMFFRIGPYLTCNSSNLSGLLLGSRSTNCCSPIVWRRLNMHAGRSSLPTALRGLSVLLLAVTIRTLLHSYCLPCRLLSTWSIMTSCCIVSLQLRRSSAIVSSIEC